MRHEEITQHIIGTAMAVLNELKPGLDEKLYERALVIELHSMRHLPSPWAMNAVFRALVDKITPAPLTFPLFQGLEPNLPLMISGMVHS